MSVASDLIEVVLLGTALAAAHNGGFLFEAMFKSPQKRESLLQRLWATLTLCLCGVIVNACIPYAYAAVHPKQRILILASVVLVWILGWHQGSTKR